MTSALLELLACAALAQSPMPMAPQGATGAAPPAPPQPPAQSTAAAVSPPPIVDLSSGAATAPPPEPAKKKKRAPSDEFVIPSNPVRVKVHKEAAKWEPVSVKTGGSAAAARSAFSWRLSKKKAKAAKTSKATAVARVYPSGDDKRLVISVFPKALEEQRTHIEIRMLVVEGFLEKLEVASVTAEPGGGPTDDAKQLDLKGVGYQEESPASGSVTLSAVDVKAGKKTFNAGKLSMAAFSETELNPRSLGFATAEWAARGLTDGAKR